MKKRIVLKGVTMVEMVITTLISVTAMMLLWKGVLFLQRMFSDQMKLDRMSQSLILTQDITQNTKAARRILSVGPDHLEIEIYNFSAFNLLDPKLYETSKRIRYQYYADEQSGWVDKEIYNSTESTKPDQINSFLKNVDLSSPTASKPFFFPTYLVSGSTVGIQVEFTLHRPFSKELWSPIKEEVYVQAE